MVQQMRKVSSERIREVSCTARPRVTPIPRMPESLRQIHLQMSEFPSETQRSTEQMHSLPLSTLATYH